MYLYIIQIPMKYAVTEINILQLASICVLYICSLHLVAIVVLTHIYIHMYVCMETCMSLYVCICMYIHKHITDISVSIHL